MKKHITILLLSMFTSVCVWSQTAQDTLVASQYFATADSLLTERKHDESIVFFEKALQIYQKHKVWERVAGCYNKISKNYIRSRDYEKSFFYANRALEICENNIDKVSKEEAIAHNNLGAFYLNYKIDYNVALLHYEKGLKIIQDFFPNDYLALIKPYNRIGYIYMSKLSYELAFRYYNEAFTIVKERIGLDSYEAAKSYMYRAILFNRQGNYVEAIRLNKKAEKVLNNFSGGEQIDLIGVYNNIGLIYNTLGDLDKSIFYCEKSISKYYQLGISRPLNIALCYNIMGISFKKKGHYDKALQYYHKALRIIEDSFGKNHYDSVLCYNNIGVAYKYKGEYDQSIKYYHKALSLNIKHYGSDHSKNAIYYNNLGYVYRKKKDYAKAFQYCRESLKIRQRLLRKNHPDIADNYEYIGDIYADTKEYTKAIENYTKAITIFTENYGENHHRIAQFYDKLGDVYFVQRKYKEALKHYKKAQLANLKSDNFQASNRDLQFDQYLDVFTVLATLTDESKVYKAIFDRDKDLTALNQSISAYKQADTLIQTMRQSFTDYQDKLTFSKTAKEVYQGAIIAHLALYEVEKDQESLEQAFYYAEKSKANTLKELLTDANAKKFTGLPDDLIALEKELRIEKSFYKSRITKELSNQEVDSTKISTFENELFRVNRSQDSLIEVLEQNYPKYHELKYQNAIVTVADIQQQLDDQTTVVEFFTSDSTTYAFTISKEAIDVKSLQTKELTKKIEAFRSQVIEKDLQQYKQQAHELYTTLFKPILDQLKGDQLLIIPDGSLWHLNFDLLLTQKPTSNNPADLPYLLREYAISYGNSVNLLFSENTTTSTDVSKLQECLAFSFSDSTQVVDAPTMTLATLRDTGDDLPGTRAEIRAISEIIDGEYYYGSQAIEKNFKDKASQYNILHLALHGEVDNEHPENSKLYFTKSKDTLEDNLLYSHELFAMDIPAELTVLSACNTGSGKIAKGEGIMSLGSAFQYAGSKSLLLTNWSVSDRTTPELMQYFYKNLKEGMNKSKALQQAKLTYIKEADIHSRDPFYWGSFYLVGDTSAMHFEDNTLLYWMIGLGGIGLLFLILLWYRIRIHKGNTSNL
ncbi:CHAT domain-containing protein [Aquimarina algicola]|uniref:Tetratricopeptide repeat protein n=1 Tax=Aquimarina algicola TaxID=2589995 RepID=A0A504JJ28_9FLAO|nr:CHAT domain-containing protein [Aquimarina algicola]TPN87623.1 tetratricopeptide repeat protein [Aquimarina algicola]